MQNRCTDVEARTRTRSCQWLLRTCLYLRYYSVHLSCWCCYLLPVLITARTSLPAEAIKRLGSSQSSGLNSPQFWCHWEVPRSLNCNRAFNKLHLKSSVGCALTVVVQPSDWRYRPMCFHDIHSLWCDDVILGYGSCSCDVESRF